MSPAVVVVGIGADGWDGLGEAARAAIAEAEVLVGGARHLDLVPETGAERMPWPSPMSELLDRLPEMADRRLCVLASGDPLLHGVGTTLARRLPPGALTIIPHVSAPAIACARLGWPAVNVELVSLVGRPLEALHPALQPGRRVIVLVAPPVGAGEVAALLRGRGYGPSRLVALEELGGPGERMRDGVADGWGDEATGPLSTLAIECREAPGAPLLPRSPGLPDDAYESDGQLTKREVRAITLAALAPVPGQMLWDVGAGSGSVAIEWMRTHPSCQAVAVEARADRAGRIERNARALGVPGLRVVAGEAPEALLGLEAPDAVFVGGGLAADGLVDRCWGALAPGGRLVVNAVTLEGEGVLAACHAARGGRLVRIAIGHAEALGGFRGLRPQRPVTQWSARKPVAAP